MEKTYKSQFLTIKQLTIAMLILGVFAAMATMLIMNAIYKEGSWYVNIDSLVMKYGFLYLVGLLIAGLYFLREYYFVNDLEVKFKGDYIYFKGKWIDNDFHVNALRDFKPSRVIYGWFKKEKLILKFKDHRDHKNHQLFLILTREDAPNFEKALVDARKNASQPQ